LNTRSVHFLTKYTQAGASSRYRTFQYLPALQAAGLKCTVSPLFDGDYVGNKLATGRSSLRSVLIAFLRRLLAVMRLPRGAVVVVEYELLPFFPVLFEHWLAWRGCRVLVDYDDALFHQYDRHANSWLRYLLGNKIAKVMLLADTVVAGNAYLADYARGVGAKRVEVIPTVINLERYTVALPAHDSVVFTIGWIGSPSTARYLQAIAPALAEVCKDGRARVRLIGSGPIELPNVPLEVLAWSEDTEVKEIQRFDVGIMPLPDEPWAHGKCGFKLIQYMACGLPVIASPIGVNTEIVTEGVNGHLATTTEEWIQAIKHLKSDHIACQRMGSMGRQVVEERYCLLVTAPKWVKLLQSINSE
jgi:glycosyltransferase involved in cell wall biosynthesis